MKAAKLAILPAILLAFLLGCAGTVYIPDAPPPPKSEVKSARPGPNAMWIDGHWKWNGHKYVWMPGHWEKNPRGKWVAGHYAKRGRGHVWVPGHWKK